MYWDIISSIHEAAERLQNYERLLSFPESRFRYMDAVGALKTCGRVFGLASALKDLEGPEQEVLDLASEIERKAHLLLEDVVYVR